MSKLIESLEKGNFWKEYENAGKEAYRKHWREHMTVNILWIIYAVINRIILSFFVFGLAVFPLIFILDSYTSGTMAAINNLQSILNQINSPSDLSALVDIWIYLSLFFLLAYLALNPLKTKADREREEEQEFFFRTYGKYMLMAIGIQSDNENI